MHAGRARSRAAGHPRPAVIAAGQDPPRCGLRAQSRCYSPCTGQLNSKQVVPLPQIRLSSCSQPHLLFARLSDGWKPFARQYASSVRQTSPLDRLSFLRAWTKDRVCHGRTPGLYEKAAGHMNSGAAAGPDFAWRRDQSTWYGMGNSNNVGALSALAVRVASNGMPPNER
jgi:hypothetical protein